MKKERVLLLFIFCTWPFLTDAYVMYQNMRIDQALYGDSENRHLVFATIEQVNMRVVEDSVAYLFYDGPAEESLELRIHQTILGKEFYLPERLHLDISSFDWPRNLVALNQGTKLLVILRTNDNAFNDCWITTVIPCCSDSFATQFARVDLMNMLSHELAAVLQTKKDTPGVLEVLYQLGPILQTSDADAVRPFMRSDNIWVKRAATAALIYATEETAALRMAATDLEVFMSTTDKDQLVKDVHPDYAYAPYHLLKKCYFFMEPYCWGKGGDWSPEQTEKDCRIVEKILAFGIIQPHTIRLIQDEF